MRKSINRLLIVFDQPGLMLTAAQMLMFIPTATPTQESHLLSSVTPFNFKVISSNSATVIFLNLVVLSVLQLTIHYQKNL